MAPRLNISVRKPVGIDTKIRYQKPPSGGDALLSVLCVRPSAKSCEKTRRLEQAVGSVAPALLFSIGMWGGERDEQVAKENEAYQTALKMTPEQ